MTTSHTIRSVFDDPNLVGAAGLAPPALRLAESAGLHDLLGAHLSVPSPNPAAKATSVVVGMLAGADSIDDLDLLRHGRMPRLFTQVRATSTSGHRPGPTRADARARRRPGRRTDPIIHADRLRPPPCTTKVGQVVSARGGGSAHFRPEARPSVRRRRGPGCGGCAWPTPCVTNAAGEGSAMTRRASAATASRSRVLSPPIIRQAAASPVPRRSRRSRVVSNAMTGRFSGSRISAGLAPASMSVGVDTATSARTHAGPCCRRRGPERRPGATYEAGMVRSMICPDSILRSTPEPSSSSLTFVP